jgi:ATP adenylyltransferase
MSHLFTPWRMDYIRGNRPDDDACLFCTKPAENRDEANHILYRGETCYVILNLFPYNNGHLMVVPFQHLAALDALDEATALELTALTQRCLRVLRKVYDPGGFNIGINQGSVAGAGIGAHLHQHIVPRWAGDTNFMTTTGGTRVIPDWVDNTYRDLKAAWE